MEAPLAPNRVRDRPALVGRVDAVLVLLFWASGCAALIYEVVWFHLLRLVIGASALSIAIVLAGFMGGMCLGSLLVWRIVPSRWHPLRIYAAAEIGIGVIGLLMPILVPMARSIYVGLFGYGPLGIALRAAMAGSMLLLPTALMGATLPAVARLYAGDSRGLTGLAFLYAANTVGAVAGCLLTGFFLLPEWDVLVATAAAVALNLAVGAGALWLSNRIEPPATDQGDLAAPLPVRNRSKPAVVYTVAALSGMTALGGQVVWTRLLSLLFGGTTYTFAIILAVFLGGLGIGSGIAASAIRRGERGQLLASCQFALVAAIAYAALMIAKVVPYTSTLRVVPVRTLQVLHAIHCIEVILPAAILWGMSFPLALAVASYGRIDAGRSSGDVYAANTVGAIAGALGVSLVAIPRWGTRISQQVLIAITAFSAALLYAWLYRAEQADDAKAARPLHPALVAALALVTAGIAMRMVPPLSPLFQANGRYIWLYNERDAVPYVGEGAASTVAVREAANHLRFFHVAGKVEASNDALDLRTERLLGHLSALVHPRPESVLVVGLGAGVTAGAFVEHPEVKRIVICEIEPRVVQAAGFFAAENHAVLSNPRVTLIYDDARHFLETTHEQFDIITSDPIHPWVRGNSVLFSREYYATVKQRLNPGGLATQWVPLYETNEAAIKIQMRTFMDAFPSGTIWNTQAGRGGYDVVVMGQIEAAHIDVPDMQRRIDSTPGLKTSLAEVRIGSAVDLLASYSAGAPDLADWLRDTPANRDLSLKLEYISGLASDLQRADEIYASMTRSRTYPNELFVAPPSMEAQLRSRIGGGS
jgi:spermidine synthase